MKKYYICAALTAAGLASPLAARADVAALSGTEVQIYGVVDAGVAVTNVSGVGSRSGMLNGGLTDSLWGLRGREDLGDGWSARFQGRSEELDFKHPKIDLMTKVFKNG